MTLTIVAVSTVPLLFSTELSKRIRKGMTPLESLINVFKASDKWAPRDPVLRRAYRDFIKGQDPPHQLEGIDNVAAATENESYRF